MRHEIIRFMESNNGMISAKEALNNGFSVRTLQRLADKNHVERIAHGLYLHKDFFADPYYLAQYKSPKIIFSHLTALYLHHLMDEVPKIISATVPSNWNMGLTKERYLYKFYYSKKDVWILGQEEIDSPYGNKIKVYNKERTLCDSMAKVNQIGKNVVINAFRSYMEDKVHRDIGRLYDYAKRLNVKEQVENYVEVLQEIL